MRSQKRQMTGGGIFFMVKTEFVQFRCLKEAIRVVKEPRDDKKPISSFQALMVSTASRVRMGNIAGIFMAICIGGAGAMFWMWLVALLGSASAFVGSTSGVDLQKKSLGRSYRGPAYYNIQAVLKKRWLGLLFACTLLVTYMGGFNMVAAFNIADFSRAYSFYDASATPLIVSLVLAVIFAVCMFGGSKQISKITGILFCILIPL